MAPIILFPHHTLHCQVTIWLSSVLLGLRGNPRPIFCLPYLQMSHGIIEASKLARWCSNGEYDGTLCR